MNFDATFKIIEITSDCTKTIEESSLNLSFNVDLKLWPDCPMDGDQGQLILATGMEPYDKKS